MRTALVALLGLSASVGWATPYRVEFVGRVISLGANAPDSFFVGEEVRGSFSYADDYESQATSNLVFTVVEPVGDPTAGLPTIYQGSFPQDDSRLISQYYQGAGLALETESGFRAADTVSDYLWVGTDDSPGRFSGQTTRGNLWLSSGGLLSNLLPVGTVVDAATALRTLAGPVTTGLRIDLVPGEPDLRTVENDLVEATFRSLTDPDQLRPTGGSILFAGDEPGSQLDSGLVEFEITDFVIGVVPEPVTLLLLAACLVPLTCRR